MATVWSKKSFKKEEDEDVTSSNSTTSLLNIMETQKVRYFFNFHLSIKNTENAPKQSEAERQKKIDVKKERRKQFISIVGCDEDVANTFLCAYNESLEESVAAYFATPRETSSEKKREETKEEEEEERRIDASDGGLYTKKEFMTFYGDLKEWNVSEKVKSMEEYDRSMALSMQLASENGHDTTSNPPALSQWHGVSDISRLQAGEPRTKHDSVVCTYWKCYLESTTHSNITNTDRARTQVV